MSCWVVETSHMIDVPAEILASDIGSLMRTVQAIADEKPTKPVGKLSFKHDDDLVHATFVGLDGRKRRFMRLRRETYNG